MKLSSVLLAASSAMMVSAFDQTCKVSTTAGGSAGYGSRGWVITGQRIGDKVSGGSFCNGFVDNINCHVDGWNCHEHGDRGFKATFRTSEWCFGDDHINAAWYHATKNDFGPLFCER